VLLLVLDLEAISLTRTIGHLKTLSPRMASGPSDTDAGCAAIRAVGMVSIPDPRV